MCPWYPREVLPLLLNFKRVEHHFNASGALLLDRDEDTASSTPEWKSGMYLSTPIPGF
jgi:hypothetical protein